MLNDNMLHKWGEDSSPAPMNLKGRIYGETSNRGEHYATTQPIENQLEVAFHSLSITNQSLKDIEATVCSEKFRKTKFFVHR